MFSLLRGTVRFRRVYDGLVECFQGRESVLITRFKCRVETS